MDMTAKEFSIRTGISERSLSSFMAGKTDLEAVWVHEGKKQTLTLHLPQLTSDERDVLVAGSLINYYRGNA